MYTTVNPQYTQIKVRANVGLKIMSGYQFGHVEGYARKGGMNSKTNTRVMSMWEISEEAERKDGATPHIEKPQPPILQFGVMPSVAMKEAAEWADQTKDPLGRKFRLDGLCIAAGVISFPSEKDGWSEYRDDAIEWLKDKYGDQLKSVVEHTDEAYPHIHFYAVPKIGYRFDSVHDGYRAANEAKANGLKKGAQNAAYKSAMKTWQDDLHTACGAKYGLARTGPRRQRLTREQWKSRQAVAEQVADLMQKATEQKVDAELRAADLLQDSELQAVELLQKVEIQSAELMQDALKKAELKAYEIRKTAELQAIELVRKAEEQTQNIELQAAELLQRAEKEKPISVMIDDIDNMISTEIPEHKSGLLRNGEDLYTRKQVVQIAGKTAVKAVQKQFKAMVDFTATTALAIAKAKTEIAEEIAQELASLKKQITILSKTIIKKDAEFSELKADNDKRLYQLSKAKQLIDSADERVSKAEEKASEQEARANCLAHDLNRAEDELRALKRDSNNFTNRM
jgi:hypothetical protein